MADTNANPKHTYRVGDWVYCETSPNLPYCIRKIEELVRTPNGSVEARVTCAFRRRDVSISLLTSLDKNPFYMITQLNSNSDIEDDLCNQIANTNNSNSNDQQEKQQQGTNGDSDINDLQKHQLKHRELFYSKYTEQIQVSIIRGKCTVHLYSSDLDSYSYYLNNDDTFYYQLTYDPNQKKLLSDEGKIRVGLKYQAEIPALITKYNREEIQECEELIWDSGECGLNEGDIKKYAVIAQSIGVYARALDCNNNEQNHQKPSLGLSASNACRDITLLTSHKYLHDSKYNITKALLNFIPSNGNGPVLCKDELEIWTTQDVELFEEGLDKYGKNFYEIKKDLLSWKTLSSIIEYYYLWKSSNRYVPRKHIKETQDRKLNSVYIPNLSQKQHQAQIAVKENRTYTCESCTCTESNAWFLANISQEPKTAQYNQSNTQYLQSYNQSSVVYSSTQQQLLPQPQLLQQQQQQVQACRLCLQCWNYWKKYGSFKYIGQKGDAERPGPDRRLERMNAVRAQVHKCEFEDCGKEFKLRTQLAKHCIIAHAITIRTTGPKPVSKEMRTFCLIATPLTKASRKQFLNLRHHGRTPFKAIDLAKIKTQWFEEIRNIREILETNKCKYKSKSIADTLNLNDPKKDNKSINSNVILKYKSSTSDSYKSNRISFPKPSDEIIAKFFQNLQAQQSQSRKRTHENNLLQPDTASDDSCTSVKRTLLSTNKTSNHNARTNFKEQLRRSAQQNTFNMEQSMNSFKQSTQSSVFATTSFNAMNDNYNNNEAYQLPLQLVATNVRPNRTDHFYMHLDYNKRHKRQTILSDLSYDTRKLAKQPFRNDDTLLNIKF